MGLSRAASSRYVFTRPRSMHEKKKIGHLLVHPIARRKKRYSFPTGRRIGAEAAKEL